MSDEMKRPFATIQRLGTIMGSLFLIGGILAFVPGVTKDGMYFGVFMVNTPHNIMQSDKRFSVMGTYAASKLFMLLFTVELAERLKGMNVTSNAVHPGIVRTPMMLRAPGMFRVISYLALPFSLSPQEGAATSVHLASSPMVRQLSGLYFTNCRPAAIKTKFNTDTVRRALWEKTIQSLRQLGLMNA